MRILLCSFFCVTLLLGASPSWAAPSTPKPKSELLDTEFLNLYKSALQKFRMGQTDLAIGGAQGILRKWPKSARTLALLGWCYKAKKIYNKAIDYFQRASLLFKPKSEFFEKSQALYNAAFCYELMKQRSAAIAAWKVYITFASSYPQESQSLAFAQERVRTLEAVKIK